MSFFLSPEEVKKSTTVPRRPYLIGIFIWVGFLAAGIVLILNYGINERGRELVSIQRNMGQIAAARGADISSWLEAQKEPLAKFAADEDVRLNLFQIEEPSADLDLGARGYLRNWLADLAQKNGFVPASTGSVAAIDANVQISDLTSLTLLGRTGESLLSIGSYPATQEEITKALDVAPTEGVYLIDAFKAPDGKVYIGFLTPLYGMGGATADDRLGYLVAIKPATDLFQRLTQPGAVYQTGEVLLLRARDGIGEIISPVANEAPLSVTFDAWDGQLVESDVLTAPGGYAEGINHAGERTLAASHALLNTPWVLSVQVAHDEVMGATESRLGYQMVVLLALLGLVLFFIYGAWKTSAARVAADKAMEYAALARKFDFQAKLLRLVTDSQRNHILIADTEGRVRFANANLAKAMETLPEDLIGKPLASAVGPDAARRFTKRGQEASLSNKAVITVDRIEQDDETFRVVQTQHIPLEDNSAGPNSTPTRGTLIVEEDITDVVREREKRERTLKQVVEALVTMVDRRDPYAAEHSARVARISRALSAEMDLSDVDTDAAEMAGALMNLGKLFVPSELLTKHGALDENELKTVRDSIIASADAVAGIEFEGPVVETLRQSLEKIDGSGFPHGLSGDHILLTARIVAVSNAFVALISPRAHRKGLTLDAALETLHAQADKAYDRGVVAALVTYIENKGGRSEWESAVDEEVPMDEDNPWQR